MVKWKRCCYDRRVREEDRRQRYSLDYFAHGGSERRRTPRACRRTAEERRHNWVRVGDYLSVYVGWPEEKEG